MIPRFDFWTICAKCNKTIGKEPYESNIQLCEDCWFKEMTKHSLCGGESEPLSQGGHPVSTDGFKCKKCYDVFIIPNLLEQSQIHYSQLFGEDEWHEQPSTAARSTYSQPSPSECIQSAV